MALEFSVSTGFYTDHQVWSSIVPRWGGLSESQCSSHTEMDLSSDLETVNMFISSEKCNRQQGLYPLVTSLPEQLGCIVDVWKMDVYQQIT